MTYWDEEYEQRMKEELRTRRSPLLLGGIIIVAIILGVMYLTAGGTAPTYTTDPDGTPCKTAPEPATE